MKDNFYQQHWCDERNNPAGGVSCGKGFTISWQNGPLGKGDQRKEPNGAFVETIVQAAIDRIKFYEESRFACDENKEAIEHLETALEVLASRTKRREQSGIEGTHKEDGGQQ